jgi:integrase
VKDGAFECDYKDATGKRHLVTLKARNKTDAKVEAGELRAAAVRGVVPAPKGLSVDTVADAFLARLRGLVAAGDRAQRTLDSYEYHLRVRIRPTIGRIQVRKIRTDRIAALVTEWQRQGLSARTIRGTLITLSRVMAFAVRQGEILENPVRFLEPDERPRLRKNEKRILSHDEIKQLLDSADNELHGDAIATLLFTGLRISELCGLTAADVDFEHGLLHVRQQLSRDGKPVRLKSGAGRRDVVLLPQLATLLRRRKLAAGTGRLFPLRQRAVERALDRAADKAKLGNEPRLTPHALRHTYVSYLILELGFDATRVAEQIGHERASFTLDTYTHLFQQANHAQELRGRMEQSTFGKLLDRNATQMRPGSEG